MLKNTSSPRHVSPPLSCSCQDGRGAEGSAHSVSGAGFAMDELGSGFCMWWLCIFTGFWQHLKQTHGSELFWPGTGTFQNIQKYNFESIFWTIFFNNWTLSSIHPTKQPTPLTSNSCISVRSTHHTSFWSWSCLLRAAPIVSWPLAFISMPPMFDESNPWITRPAESSPKAELSPLDKADTGFLISTEDSSSLILSRALWRQVCASWWSWW